MDNSTTVTGNLTREPELRYTAGGRGVANLGLAVNHRYQVNGEWTEKVSFFNVVVWGPTGENAAACLSKGDRVIVTGRLEQRSYEVDGEKRSVVEIIADDIAPSLRWAVVEISKVSRTPAMAGAPAPVEAEPEF